jgi:CBS domain-containing protein
MRVQEIMTAEPMFCGPQASLSDAVQIMWDRDCGIVPVTDTDGHVIGVVTDRDICIACWSHGAKPADLKVEDTMSREVKSCGSADTVAAAEKAMQTNKVRRLPVVDENGRLKGMLSLNDIAREAEREKVTQAKKKAIRAQEVVEALAAICQPRAGGKRVLRVG